MSVELPDWFKDGAIDIGNDHYMQWWPMKEGAYIIHPHKKDAATRCMSGFNLRPGGWKLESADPVTVSPSLLCSCGDHGFIREGKWVPA